MGPTPVTLKMGTLPPSHVLDLALRAVAAVSAELTAAPDGAHTTYALTADADLKTGTMGPTELLGTDSARWPPTAQLASKRVRAASRAGSKVSVHVVLTMGKTIHCTTVHLMPAHTRPVWHSFTAGAAA
jgi:hypothetical protein